MARSREGPWPARGTSSRSGRRAPPRPSATRSSPALRCGSRPTCSPWSRPWSRPSLRSSQLLPLACPTPAPQGSRRWPTPGANNTIGSAGQHRIRSAPERATAGGGFPGSGASTGSPGPSPSRAAGAACRGARPAPLLRGWWRPAPLPPAPADPRHRDHRPGSRAPQLHRARRRAVRRAPPGRAEPGVVSDPLPEQPRRSGEWHPGRREPLAPALALRPGLLRGDAGGRRRGAGPQRGL